MPAADAAVTSADGGMTPTTVPVPAAGRAKRPAWMAANLAVVSSIAAAALTGGAVVIFRPSGDAILVGSILVVLLAWPVSQAVAGRFDALAPPVLIALAYGTMFVVRPAAVLITNDYQYNVGIGSVDFRSGFTKTLVVALVGAVSLLGGYTLAAGRRLAARAPAPPRAINADVTVMIAATFAALGVGFFTLFIVTSGGASALTTFLAGRSVLLTSLQSSANKYLIFGPILLVPSALILLTIAKVRRDGLALLFGLAAVLAVLFVAAPTGARSMLLTLAIGGAILRYHLRGTRPRFVVLLAAGVLGLFLAAAIGTARTASVRQTVGIGQTVLALASDPTRILDPLVQKEDSAEATGMAALFSLPPGRVQPTDGQATIGDLFVRPIPRALWPGKPYPPRQVAARALFGAPADTLQVAPEFSVLLYPYLDAGFAGVILLLAAYGVLLRFLFEYWRRHRTSVFACLLFALAAPALITGLRDGPVDTMARVMFLLVPLVSSFSIGALAARARW